MEFSFVWVVYNVKVCVMSFKYRVHKHGDAYIEILLWTKWRWSRDFIYYPILVLHTDGTWYTQQHFIVNLIILNLVTQTIRKVVLNMKVSTDNVLRTLQQIKLCSWIIGIEKMPTRVEFSRINTSRKKADFSFEISRWIWISLCPSTSKI